MCVCVCVCVCVCAIRGKQYSTYLPVGYGSDPEGTDHVMCLQYGILIIAESDLHVLNEVRQVVPNWG